jgi:hypothetical protein
MGGIGVWEVKGFVVRSLLFSKSSNQKSLFAQWALGLFNPPYPHTPIPSQKRSWILVYLRIYPHTLPHDNNFTVDLLILIQDVL